MNFTYTVKRDRFYYEIFYNDELIFVGKRKQRLLRGDITQIYFPSDNNLFAELQEQYFMFFGFGYTINYMHDDKLIKIRNKFGVQDGVFDNKTYSIKYRLFTRDGIYMLTISQWGNTLFWMLIIVASRFRYKLLQRSSALFLL